MTSNNKHEHVTSNALLKRDRYGLPASVYDEDKKGTIHGSQFACFRAFAVISDHICVAL